MKVERVELGCAGHLIVSSSCRWRRHTQIGPYRVSTVGNYFPPNQSERAAIGGDGQFFETMVFALTAKQAPRNDGCGCRAVESWSELESYHYSTAGEAQQGHETYVAKYLSMAKKKGGGR